MIQQGQVFKLKARSADRGASVGLPVSPCRSRFGEVAGGRVWQQGRGAEGASEQARPAFPRRPCGHSDARRVGRGVLGHASG